MQDTWAGKAKTGLSENWSLGLPDDLETRASKPYNSFSYVPTMILKLFGSDSFGSVRGDPLIRFAEIGSNFCFLALPIATLNLALFVLLRSRCLDALRGSSAELIGEK